MRAARLGMVPMMLFELRSKTDSELAFGKGGIVPLNELEDRLLFGLYCLLFFLLLFSSLPADQQRESSKSYAFSYVSLCLSRSFKTHTLSLSLTLSLFLSLSLCLSLSLFLSLSMLSF